MKSIIVAAGQGSRLMPLTADVPKCMVEYKKKPIINYILNALEEAGISDNVIINGYKREALIGYLADREVRFYTNEYFDTTNMVYTLFCAEAEMDDDIIISYADIIYQPQIIKQLMASEADISCVVDLKWKELWEQRMDNPLDDAESMKVDADQNIIELGKKANSYADVEGQYIGLIKVSKGILPSFIKHYHSLNKSSRYDGKDFKNMYMTSFLQGIIENLSPVKAEFINGGWLEIDCVDDINSEMV